MSDSTEYFTEPGYDQYAATDPTVMDTVDESFVSTLDPTDMSEQYAAADKARNQAVLDKDIKREMEGANKFANWATKVTPNGSGDTIFRTFPLQLGVPIRLCNVNPLRGLVKLILPYTATATLVQVAIGMDPSVYVNAGGVAPNCVLLTGPVGANLVPQTAVEIRTYRDLWAMLYTTGIPGVTVPLSVIEEFGNYNGG